jgi:hypothetical protein
MADKDFIDGMLTPYFKDLYKDLLIRSNIENHLDKVTVTEYTKLPGIINDRFHHMLSVYKSKLISKEVCS